MAYKMTKIDEACFHEDGREVTPEEREDFEKLMDEILGTEEEFQEALRENEKLKTK